MDGVDILGIDLGTTKSGIALWDPDTAETRILLNGDGESITPSVVTFDPQSREPIVGKRAIARMQSHPEQVIYSVKRFIGRTADDKWVQQDRQRVTYDIQASEQAVVIYTDGSVLTPQQVSAEVLRKLKDDAATALGRPVSQVVISVPAYFNESQRRATREAGELAGMHVTRIIQEPAAAALAFGLGAEAETVAVYDLGGGTFDISILHIEHGLFRVKAIGGDAHLGGDDFDQAVVEWMNKAFEDQHPGASLSLENDARVRSRLREEARRIKVALDDSLEQPIQLSDLPTADGRLLCLETTMTRATFETLIRRFIDYSLELVEQAMNAAHVRPEDISQFLLVGGQTRTPAVRAAISGRFGKPLNDSVHPEEAVARGAAILGARLCGYLKEQVALWDVNPLSLGVELADGKLDVIIPANEPIPVERWRRGPQAFTTQRDGQKSIRFKVFQGERPMAVDNAYIGEVILPLATARRAGDIASTACLKSTTTAS